MKFNPELKCPFCQKSIDNPEDPNNSIYCCKNCIITYDETGLYNKYVCHEHFEQFRYSEYTIQLSYFSNKTLIFTENRLTRTYNSALTLNYLLEFDPLNEKEVIEKIKTLLAFQ